MKVYVVKDRSKKDKKFATIIQAKEFAYSEIMKDIFIEYNYYMFDDKNFQFKTNFAHNIMKVIVRIDDYIVTTYTRTIRTKEVF